MRCETWIADILGVVTNGDIKLYGKEEHKI